MNSELIKNLLLLIPINCYNQNIAGDCEEEGKRPRLSARLDRFH